MRRSDAYEDRQAYNGQAVVCVEGCQLIVEKGSVATTADAPGFADMILGLEGKIGLPRTVFGHTGLASRKAVETTVGQGVDPLVVIGGSVDRCSHDFRPEPPSNEPPRSAGRVVLRTASGHGGVGLSGAAGFDAAGELVGQFGLGRAGERNVVPHRAA